MVNRFKQFLFSAFFSQLLFGMLGALLILLFLHFTEPQPRPIATVDVTGIVNEFVQAQTAQKLPADELKARVNAFSSRLQAALDQVARQHHLVLMMREAVADGAPDLTMAVKRQMALIKQIP